jgi:hypothetical protein
MLNHMVHYIPSLCGCQSPTLNQTDSALSNRTANYWAQWFTADKQSVEKAPNRHALNVSRPGLGSCLRIADLVTRMLSLMCALTGRDAAVPSKR